jgi:hypothetical protein
MISALCNDLSLHSGDESYGAEHYSRGHQLGHFTVSQHFMDSEGSEPNSQELSTGSYPEPDQSSPHHPTHLSKFHPNIIHPLTSWSS